MRPERHEEAADAAALCAQLRHVYWIGGGSGAGKSVIARRMAARHGLYLYATDDVMPDHGSRCAPGDCPFLMPAMVGVLARAFYDDPPMVWMIPDHQSRDRRLRRMFITILRHEAMRHGGVDVA